jgi:hypothetical protein
MHPNPMLAELKAKQQAVKSMPSIPRSAPVPAPAPAAYPAEGSSELLSKLNRRREKNNEEPQPLSKSPPNNPSFARRSATVPAQMLNQHIQFPPAQPKPLPPTPRVSELEDEVYQTLILFFFSFYFSSPRSLRHFCVRSEFDNFKQVKKLEEEIMEEEREINDRVRTLSVGGYLSPSPPPPPAPAVQQPQFIRFEDWIASVTALENDFQQLEGYINSNPEQRRNFVVKILDIIFDETGGPSSNLNSSIVFDCWSFPYFSPLQVPSS